MSRKIFEEVTVTQVVVDTPSAPPRVQSGGGGGGGGSGDDALAWCVLGLIGLGSVCALCYFVPSVLQLLVLAAVVCFVLATAH